jgi:hypothetical protein
VAGVPKGPSLTAPQETKNTKPSQEHWEPSECAGLFHVRNSKLAFSAVPEATKGYVSEDTGFPPACCLTAALTSLFLSCTPLDRLDDLLFAQTVQYLFGNWSRY